MLRFRVPVLNMDENALLDEAALLFNGEVEPAMKRELQNTIKKLAEVEPFEETLVNVLLTFFLYICGQLDECLCDIFFCIFDQLGECLTDMFVHVIQKKFVP